MVKNCAFGFPLVGQSNTALTDTCLFVNFFSIQKVLFSVTVLQISLAVSTDETVENEYISYSF